jgi:hypothetical protein
VGGSLALKTDPPAGHPAPPTRSAEMKKVAKQRYICSVLHAENQLKLKVLANLGQRRLPVACGLRVFWYGFGEHDSDHDGCE